MPTTTPHTQQVKRKRCLIGWLNFFVLAVAATIAYLTVTDQG